jgi:hypothetical protein
MHQTTRQIPVTLLALLHGILSAAWTSRHRRARTDERGDVPGWVLITVMTAGLVTAIWVVAKDQLEQILTDALDSVTGPKD